MPTVVDPRGVARTFDWVSRHDPRSRDWDVADYLAARPSSYDRVQNARIAALTKRVAALEGNTPPVPPSPPSGTVLWDCPQVLDQAQTGMCVGYGCTDYAQASPGSEQIVYTHSGDTKGDTPAQVYFLAQDFAGQAHDDQAGTAVIDGAKALQQLTRIVAYQWAFTVADVAAAVTKLGPVVLGIPWTDHMMNPDPSGRIFSTGTVVGGHCILDRGYDPTTGLHTLRNSWGPGWGIGGDCVIHDTDLAALLAQQGEACVPVKA